MLTVFTSPKSFKGHINVTQNNAIRSWTLLRPKCDIILFGDEDGTAEAAEKFSARHIPRVECNEYGTPLISAMFKTAQEISSYPLVCYVNADIILTSDFLPAIQRITFRKFLAVGQRWNIDIKEPLEFDNTDWEKALRACLLRAGKLHPPTGIDYFVFPRGQFRDIPPLVVGRAGWDMWMIFRARSLKTPVIDATQVITAVHQNHDYSHHPDGMTGVWQGAEAKQNRAIIGGYNHILNIRDATWSLSKNGLNRTSPLRRLFQSGRRWVGSVSRPIKKTRSIW